MYAQLGTTIFEGLFSFDEFKRRVAGEYAELKLIGGKPDLQRVGKALEVITLRIRLHDSFCRPDIRYNELVAYCNNGDILPFVDGYGNVIGNFVLEELEQNVLQTDGKGMVTHCECDLSLREFVDPNRALSRANDAKRGAFAIGATSVSLKNITVPPSVPADMVKSVQLVGAGSSRAVDNVVSANNNPAAAAGYVNAAVKAANDVNDAVVAMQAKVEAYGDKVRNAESLLTAADTVKSNAVALSDSLGRGDLSGSLANSGLLDAAVKQLNVAALPVQKQLILR